MRVLSDAVHNSLLKKINSAGKKTKQTFKEFTKI